MNNQDRAGGEREALLPCPFCGGDAVIEERGNNFTKKREAEIKCTRCRTKRTVGAVRNTLEWCVKIVTEGWNTRQDQAALTTLQGEVERYKNILQQVHDYIEEGDFITKKSALIAIKNTINQALNPTPHE